MSLKVGQLKNHYLIVRHGQSTANVSHLVITHPKIACNQYGLSEKGKEQCIERAISLKDLIFNRYGYKMNDIYIYYSDFLRTVETASIIYKILQLKDKSHFIPTPLIRERYYGDLNKNDGTFSDYRIIWKYDRINANHNKFNVESVNHVLKRSKKLIENIEKKFKNSSNKLIILVSHGDTSQILETWFKNISPASHGLDEPLKTAQFRVLTAIKSKL